MTWPGRGGVGGGGEEAWCLPGIEGLTMLARKNTQKRLTKETKNNLLRSSQLQAGCARAAWPLLPQGPGFIIKAVPVLTQSGLLWNTTTVPGRLSMPRVHNSCQSY